MVAQTVWTLPEDSVVVAVARAEFDRALDRAFHRERAMARKLWNLGEDNDARKHSAAAHRLRRAMDKS